MRRLFWAVPLAGIAAILFVTATRQKRNAGPSPARAASDSRSKPERRRIIRDVTSQVTPEEKERFAEQLRRRFTTHPLPLERKETEGTRIYSAVEEGRWGEEEMARLRRAFLQAADRETWVVACWAVTQCPSAEAADWIREVVRTTDDPQRRIDALRLLGQRSEADATALLNEELACEDGNRRMAAALAVLERADGDESLRPLEVAIRANPEHERLCEEYPCESRRTP